jgi:hypothetical protein
VAIEQVLHFGGNGHAGVRIEAASAALRLRGGPTLVDVLYPGFEGRRGVDSLDAFLESTARFCRDVDPRPVAGVASGIGALVALGLRSLGELRDLPLIFQGPVLWGLEHRTFPRLMKPKLARHLLKWLFTVPVVQGRFVRKHFRKPLDRATQKQFFAGYADCSVFGSFFDWFTPAYLRTLEARFHALPEALERVTVWTGGCDHVVGLDDVRATERALGVSWPVVEFPSWGHYPIMDEPEEWADALRLALDDA